MGDRRGSASHGFQSESLVADRTRLRIIGDKRGGAEWL